MKTVIIHHIFTHDLRWKDNITIRCAITKAVKELKADKVIIQGWICLDPKQLNIIMEKQYSTDLDYRGVPGAITFLQSCESLLNTPQKHRLGTIQVCQISVQELSKKLLKSPDSSSFIVSISKQYTPFAQKRQTSLKKHWESRFVCEDDHSLVSPKTLMELTQKTQYVVFSPFYTFATNLRSKWKPKLSIPSKYKQHLTIQPNSSNTKQLQIIQNTLNPLKIAWKCWGELNTKRLIMRTNRTLGLQIIRKLKRSWKHNTYQSIRNDIHQSTSMLARFLNSGVISIREVWKSLGKSMPAFERQLVFRSFYACRMNAICNPKWNHSRQSSLTLQEFSSPSWKSINRKHKEWNAWIHGNTGVPIVDASMRYLKQHGWLHNRLRMIVASYLTRILHISWRYGEAWFAKHLFDYDATQNHFGWKGQAALSRDSNTYFRVINPWLQSRKYDKDVTFIRTYIPELSKVETTDILNWETQYIHYPNCKYPSPIIPNHKIAAKQSIQIWKQLY